MQIVDHPLLLQPPDGMTLYWCYKCGHHDAIPGGDYFTPKAPRGSLGHRNDGGYICTGLIRAVVYVQGEPPTDPDIISSF